MRLTTATVLAVAAVTAASGVTVGTATAANGVNVERISQNSQGQSGNGASTNSDVSANGRFVVFDSRSNNLDGEQDGDARSQIYMRDRVTGITQIISVKRVGDDTPANHDSFAPTISDDGNFIAFTSKASDLPTGSPDLNSNDDVFIFNRVTQKMIRVDAPSGQSNGRSLQAVISGNGDAVAFTTLASNFSSGDKNGLADVYRYNRITGTVNLISKTPIGAAGNGQSQHPAIDNSGTVIAFESEASNLIADDTNNRTDVFQFRTNAISRVSVTSSGGQANDNSTRPSVSRDGGAVAFQSIASNLVGGDTNNVSDIFHRDVDDRTTRRVSLGTLGRQANGSSFDPDLNADGSRIVFQSGASNLSGDDTNGRVDVFMARPTCGISCSNLVSRTETGAVAQGATSENAAISSDGTFVSFSSTGQLTSDPDVNGLLPDIYARVY